MRNDYIAVMDSGIGGISVLRALKDAFPNERFLYYGDNYNAPYGNRSVQNLLSLSMRNIDYIKSFGVKAVVLACNTLSVNLIHDICAYSGLPIFGVFPPVESCIIAGEKTLLMATVRTAENYKSDKNVDVIGLPTLVNSIEKNTTDLSRVDFSKILSESAVGNFINRKGYYNTVILGCTHYEFIKNQIFDHFCPQKIICGHFFTIKIVEKFLKINKSLVNYNDFDVLFVGENSLLNQNFWEKSGQSILKTTKKL